jgi:lipopolysaccharide cholinephosphotransferase
MQEVELEVDFSCSYGKEKLREQQAIMWDMYCEVSKIFDKKSIRYFITNGSLLGAIRHGGFIPWDDDLDICILKEDYDIAIKLLQDQLPSKYIIHNKQNDPKFQVEWNKVRYINSEIWLPRYPSHSDLLYRGISIDVFRVWVEKQTQFETKYYKIIKSSKASCVWRFNEIFSGHKISLYSLLAFCYHFVRFLFFDIISCFFRKREVYVKDPESYLPPMEKEWVFPLSTALFNGKPCPIPNNYNAILTRFYGDWKKYPDREKRIPESSNVLVYDNK